MYPIVLQDSTAIAVCHVARARQHRTFRQWARESKSGMGWWYGLKLHVQCNEAGRLCGFDLTTATVDDRTLLDPLTRWLKDGIVVGDGGYLSQAKAKELGARDMYLLTTTRKNMRYLASQFQLACLPLRHRVWVQPQGVRQAEPRKEVSILTQPVRLGATTPEPLSFDEMQLFQSSPNQ